MGWMQVERERVVRPCDMKTVLVAFQGAAGPGDEPVYE